MHAHIHQPFSLKNPEAFINCVLVAEKKQNALCFNKYNIVFTWARTGFQINSKKSRPNMTMLYYKYLPNEFFSPNLFCNLSVPVVDML